MKLTELLNEVSLTPKAAKFLDAIQMHDRGIKDLKQITVDASPQGNWSVYYKGKRLGTVNARLLDDATIMKYGLEHYEHSYFGKHESVNEAETQKIVKDEDAKKSFMKHLEMNNKSIQKMADFHKVTPDRIVKGLEKFIRILHIEAPNGKPTVFSISLKLKEPKSKVSVNDGFVYDENGKQYKYNGPF
jgi:hypothetical protein